MEKRVWKGLNGLLTEKRVGIACCVLLGLTLLPVAALSVYNHPCSDDYSYGLYVAQAVRSGGSLWEVLAAAAKETAGTDRVEALHRLIAFSYNSGFLQIARRSSRYDSRLKKIPRNRLLPG